MALKWEDTMQKFSLSSINDDFVYGFDLDGTLYDEFEFISQAYVELANYLSRVIQMDEDKIYKTICGLWLQYGSSKPDLFQHFFIEFGVVPSNKQIRDCLNIYRTADFELNLPSRSKVILDLITESKAKMFLMTDGNSSLQRRKIQSLGLEKWFEEGSIFISGDFGTEYQKPNTLIRAEIEKAITDLSNVVYFGDRNVDMEFAKSMNFNFFKMYSMNEVI